MARTIKTLALGSLLWMAVGTELAAQQPVYRLGYSGAGITQNRWSGEGEHFIGKGPNQIEYEDEDPEIRKTFEYELAKNGLASRMPREIYENRKAS